MLAQLQIRTHARAAARDSSIDTPAGTIGKKLADRKSVV